MRPFHTRAPIVVLVLTSLSLSPLPRTHTTLGRGRQREEKHLQARWRMIDDIDSLRHPRQTRSAVGQRHGSDRKRRASESHAYNPESANEYDGLGATADHQTAEDAKDTYTSTRCAVQAPCIFPEEFSMSALSGNGTVQSRSVSRRAPKASTSK